MKPSFLPQIRILRKKPALVVLGFSHATLYDISNPTSSRHDPSFPKRVRIGARSVGWFEHELIAWLESKRT